MTETDDNEENGDQESPEDEPNISGLWTPNTWTIGHTADMPGGVTLTGLRDITDADHAIYMEAVHFVMGQKEQVPIRLIGGNYTEFRALQASMAMVFTTTKQENWPDPRESQFHLRRTLLNWLNSIRLFDDHNRTRIVRTYGDPSPELDAYKQARSQKYDGVPGYRFMFELRNFAQHCGEVPVQARIQMDGAGSTLELFFDRDQLLSEFGNWKLVKPDLEAGPEHIGIDSPIEEAMGAITQLALEVVAIDKPKFDESIRTIEMTLGPPPSDPNLRPALFRMRTETDTAGGEVTKIDLGPVFVVGQPSSESSEHVEVPDFSAHRPEMTTERSQRSCQGPLDKVTHRPAETCGERATMSFYFPHQDGIAFLFACEGHALSLGQWAGKRFGGSFGGEAEKADRVMQLAANQFARIDEPHGAEYDQLVPVSGAPHVQSLFNATPP